MSLKNLFLICIYLSLYTRNYTIFVYILRSKKEKNTFAKIIKLKNLCIDLYQKNIYMYIKNNNNKTKNKIKENSQNSSFLQ